MNLDNLKKMRADIATADVFDMTTYENCAVGICSRANGGPDYRKDLTDRSIKYVSTFQVVDFCKEFLDIPGWKVVSLANGQWTDTALDEVTREDVLIHLDDLIKIGEPTNANHP